MDDLGVPLFQEMSIYLFWKVITWTPSCRRRLLASLPWSGPHCWTRRRIDSSNEVYKMGYISWHYHRYIMGDNNVGFAGSNKWRCCRSNRSGYIMRLQQQLAKAVQCWSVCVAVLNESSGDRMGIYLNIMECFTNICVMSENWAYPKNCQFRWRKWWSISELKGSQATPNGY